MIKMDWLPELENLESSRPGTLSEEDYAKLMMSYIYNHKSVWVKFLWQRIPDALKASPLLVLLADTARSVEDKDFSVALLMLSSITALPDGLVSLSMELSRGVQEISVEHIRRVYDVITLDRFAVITGFGSDVQSALEFATELGFEYNPTKQLISIAPQNLLPESTLDDENWSSGLDTLENISDTVTALRKAPFVVPEPNK